MNVIQRTCSRLSKCKFLHHGTFKDVVNLENKNSRLLPSLASTYLKTYDSLCENQQTRNLRIERKSGTIKQNWLIEKDVSSLQKGICEKLNLHLIERSLLKHGVREMCSGHGPNWPSRLGRVKIKREERSRGTIDVLEDSNAEQSKTKEIIDNVNNQIANHSYGRLFAVVLMDKHQHKITSGDLLMCNHDVGASLGQVIRLDKALLIGGKDFTLLGRPLVPRDGFRIVATVVEKNLSQHKVCYKFRKRTKTNNPKTRWIRDCTTTLRINSIELLKAVDNTIDRAGFEPPLNKNPLSGL